MSARDHAVCVLGMHGSGTSFTARILELLGVDMGLSAGWGSPGWGGQVTELNDEIIGVFGGGWSEVPELPLDWQRSPSLAPLRRRARRLIEERAEAGRAWGLEDPRLSLTLPLWRDLLPNPSFVVCVRNPIDVAAALGTDLPGAADHSGDGSANLWLAYTAQALEHARGAAHIGVLYRDYVEDPALQVERLAAFAGDGQAPSPAVLQQARALAADELEHGQASDANLLAPGRLPPEAAALYLTLLTMLHGGERPTDGWPRIAVDLAERLWRARAESIAHAEQIAVQQRELDALRAEPLGGLPGRAARGVESLLALRRLVRWRLGAARSRVEAVRRRPLTRPSRREGESEPRGSRDRGGAVVSATSAPPPEDPLERLALREERETTAAFARRYSEPFPAALDAAPPETPSEAIPVDRRGVLVDDEATGTVTPTVDVVVCVHDALADLRRCLRSLLAKTGRPLRLLLVDDGSGPETKAFLRGFVEANPQAVLITREGPAHGYTLAANEGLRASSGDYVVLLNSDTIVTFGWLERLVECGESDPAIGIVGPLSNAASHQSVPELREAGAWAVNELPSFMTADGLAFLLARSARHHSPRLPFLNGFCYAIKREVIDAIGHLDEERFASGYCEENDYSYRASLAGFELAVADAAYVFHAKSRSYGQEGRREIAKRNYQIFLEKHGEEDIQPLVRDLERDRSLDEVRGLVRDATLDAASFARAFRSACPEPLRVGFVLHGMGRSAAGGVHSIYQETRGMRALGVDARILVPAESLDNARALYGDADEVFVGFRQEEEGLEAETADRDVIVATHFGTVALLRSLRERRDDFLPAYYVQDYEPFFFNEQTDLATEALASYDLIPDQVLFAKTQWLCDLIGRLHGVHVSKVEPSIDHDVYRPHRRRGRGAVRVSGMVRPRTPRRQPVGTLRILDRLQSEFGSRVEIAAFGSQPRDLRRLAPRRAARVRNLGLLNREEVAAALADTDVFLDFSSYQAFGRTALEAMACGCAAVVPRTGGSDEFAVHGENAFVVDTTDEADAFEAIAELIVDRDRLRRMQANAIQTAGRYSVVQAALSEYLLFADEHGRRQRASAAVGSGQAKR